MTPHLLADPADVAFVDHVVRILGENLTERWATPDAGDLFARFYTHDALAKPLDVVGWSRVWVLRDAGYIVGHASLYDLGEPDGVCFGHISVERSHRRTGATAALQAARLGYCDQHALTLCGPIAVGNWVSAAMCKRYGFEFLKTEPGVVWVYRPPGQREASAAHSHRDGRPR